MWSKARCINSQHRQAATPIESRSTTQHATLTILSQVSCVHVWCAAPLTHTLATLKHQLQVANDLGVVALLVGWGALIGQRRVQLLHHVFGVGWVGGGRVCVGRVRGVRRDQVGALARWCVCVAAVAGLETGVERALARAPRYLQLTHE